MPCSRTGERLHSCRIDPGNRRDADWVGAADRGGVIFISGDHLEIADTGVDLAVASRLGTLLAGPVRFHG